MNLILGGRYQGGTFAVGEVPMFGFFAAFFIVLFVVAGVAALAGHILLIEALVRPRAIDPEPRQPDFMPKRTVEPVRLRTAA